MPEMVGTVGEGVPWKMVENAGMLVKSFARLGAEIAGGKLDRIGGLPPPGATTELFFKDPTTAPDGTGSVLVILPVTNVEDFRVFAWVFEERCVADDEEVVVMYLPAGGLFSGGKPRFGVAIAPKGTLRAEHEAARRGEPATQTEPIWLHLPRTPFAPTRS